MLRTHLNIVFYVYYLFIHLLNTYDGPGRVGVGGMKWIKTAEAFSACRKTDGQPFQSTLHYLSGEYRPQRVLCYLWGTGMLG